MIMYKIYFDYFINEENNHQKLDLTNIGITFDQFSSMLNEYLDIYNVKFNPSLKYMILVYDDILSFSKNLEINYMNMGFRDAYNDRDLFIEKTVLCLEDEINKFFQKHYPIVGISFLRSITVIPYNNVITNKVFNDFPIYRMKTGKDLNDCKLIDTVPKEHNTAKELIAEMIDISKDCEVLAKKICDRKNSKNLSMLPYVYIIEADINNFNALAISLHLLLDLNNRCLGPFVYEWASGNNVDGFDPYLGNTIIFPFGVYSSDSISKKEMDKDTIRPKDIYNSLFYDETYTNIIIRSAGTEYTKEIVDSFGGYGINCIIIKDTILTLNQAKTYIRKMVKRIPEHDDKMIKSAMQIIKCNRKVYSQGALYHLFKSWKRNYDTELSCPSCADLISKEENKNDIKTNSINKLIELIGLESVKDQINKIICTVKMEGMIKDKCGGDIKIESHNMVFTGNPGTGKTVVGKMLADILFENKVTKTSKFVYAGRESLVGKYVGWTATKVKEKFEDAKGGVLFIDEAYSLIDDNFGQEAINTLVKFMDNNKDTIVIFSGYPKEIKNLIDCNPGMESRIKYFIDFPDYSIDELVDILKLKLSKRNLKATDEAIDVAREKIKSDMNDEKFGNGRYVRNLLEKAIENHAVRISKLKKVSNDRLVTIEAKDFEEVDTSKIKINSKSIGF